MRRNYVYDQNIQSQFVGQSNFIYSNIFDGTQPNAIIRWAANGMASYQGFVFPDTVASDGLVVANNVFTNADAMLRLAGFANTMGLMANDVFANNICMDWRQSRVEYGPGDTVFVNTAVFSDSTLAAPWSYKNNAFYKSTGDDIVFSVGRDGRNRDNYNVNMLNARTGCSGNVYSNPLFVGGTGHSADNFRLASNSPVNTGGVSLASLLPPSMSGQAVDYYGNPFGPTPSRGAIQYPFIGISSLSITAPTDTLNIGTQITCSAVVNPGNTDVASYSWTVRVSNNVIMTGGGPTISLYSTSPSIYSFSLTVTDKFGYTRSATANVVVAELPHIELYGPNNIVANGATVNYNVTVLTFHASTVGAT